MKKNSLLSWLIPVAIFVIFIGGCILHYERGTYYYSRDFQHVTGTDDAFISYRYGWNLANYHVLSWNESGFRRTEGFTNPLWVLLSAAWAVSGDKDLIYPAMVVTSILITIGLLYFEGRQVMKKTDSVFGLFGIFLLCVSPVFWLHTTSGLESAVFGVGTGLLAYTTITEQGPGRIRFWLTNSLAFVLIILRSDGFVYLLILLIGLVLNNNRNWKMLIYGGMLGLLGLLIWRWVNFGQLIPNTAIAKMNFGALSRLPTGLVLLIQSLLGGGLVLLLAGIFGLMAEPKSIRISALITITGWMAYYVYIGGDLFLERHLIGVMVLSAGFSQSFFVRILQAKRGWLLALALLIGMLAPLYTGDPRFTYLEGKPQDPWILMGKEIAWHRAQYGTIVTFPAGKIPFYAGGDFIDELGLNDPDLSKVKQPKFIPGHSAGSHELAIDLARRSSQTYSYFAFGFDLAAENMQDVLLWVNNYHPEDGVHKGLDVTQRDKILHAPPFSYTLLIRGK
jgi:hypothetical protein